MTFDEIQKTIEGMLAVQRNLQESQLKLVEKQANHEEVLSRLEQNQQTHEEVLSRLEQNQQTHDENLNRIENLISELAKIALASNKALLERIETVEERVFPEQN